MRKWKIIETVPSQVDILKEPLCKAQHIEIPIKLASSGVPNPTICISICDFLPVPVPSVWDTIILSCPIIDFNP